MLAAVYVTDRVNIEINMPSLSQTQTISAQAPIFVVGMDREGHWLAMETHGTSGGIFSSKDAAMRYAVLETDHRPNAVRLAPSALELAL